MIQSPELPKRDRLAAFFGAFELSAGMLPPDEPFRTANLIVTGGEGRPETVFFHPLGAPAPEAGVLAAAVVDFGGTDNPLVDALPESTTIRLNHKPGLAALVEAFVFEAGANRCGRQVALDRLCEVIVLLILREVIDAGATHPGLLAGLSHPALHRVLVAIHDAPQKDWRVDELARIAGMSRSRFMAVFPQVLGTTPAAYLNGWRLTLGQRELRRGGAVKAVARRVGFGSPAAFSRAYTRLFGFAPTDTPKTPAGTVEVTGG